MSAKDPGGTSPPENLPPLPPEEPLEKGSKNSTPGNTIEKEQNLFSASDLGPYEVYMENEQENSAIGNIHPMKIGRILREKKITDIQSILKKGRNRIAVRFFSYQSANNLVKSNLGKEQQLKIYVPRHLTTCQGIVRDVDTSLTIDEIMANIRSTKTVINVRRLNRRMVKEDNEVTYEPTKTVVLTFKGSMLPKNVSLYYVSLDVKTYILPVVRCTKCMRFGHNAKACKGSERCRNCGNAPHPDCSCQTKCIHCGEPHDALYAKCPELKRQQQIKEVMAFENVTFFEAAKRFPRSKRPTSNVSASTLAYSSPQLFPSVTLASNAETQSDRWLTPGHIRARSFAETTRSPISVRSPGRMEPSQGKKKRTLSPGYNQAQHNELLWFPNGNATPLSNCSTSTLTASPPGYSTNSHSTNQILNPFQLQQLKSLLQPLPNPEQTLSSIYSILAEILTNNISNNGQHNSFME